MGRWPGLRYFAPSGLAPLGTTSNPRVAQTLGMYAPPTQLHLRLFFKVRRCRGIAGFLPWRDKVLPLKFMSGLDRRC
jgi:hypothetical protein